MVSRSPYLGLPAQQVWRKAPQDPQGGARFTIDKNSSIATAGSCFAQRIAERLQASGYRYLVTEPGPIFESREWLREHHYGAYSARYGDVYTTLQLLQLVQRAAGRLEPQERSWRKNDAYHDPFRPRIQPGGFASEEAMLADRRQHLAAVRSMFEQADFFVFTLGLTEVWCCTSDGSALPLCPGVEYGTFDSSSYYFRNLSVDENVRYLNEAIEIIKEFNPALRIILTVSPVPLAATVENRHVLQSTVISKSILRLTAEEMRRRHSNVDYFASYEIVNGVFDGTHGFEADGRTVTAEAVDRVMASFFTHFVSVDTQKHVDFAPIAGAPKVDKDPCDEVFLLQYIAQSD